MTFALRTTKLILLHLNLQGNQEMTVLGFAYDMVFVWYSLVYGFVYFILPIVLVTILLVIGLVVPLHLLEKRKRKS